MRYYLSFFGLGGKSGTQKKSPVYAFFAEADSKEKKKVYKKAISGAEKEQKDLIARYNKDFAGIPS